MNVTRDRPDRQFGPHVVRNQSQQLRRSLRGLEREGFRHVFTLSTPEEVSSVSIVRQPLWNNLKHEHGPFDIIGDVHGCYDELSALLAANWLQNRKRTGRTEGHSARWTEGGLRRRSCRSRAKDS